jgi:hypothetical protein
MAPVRSSASHGGSGDISVCSGSDDSSHPVKHKQIQLARRSERRSNSAKRGDASEVIHFFGGGQVRGKVIAHAPALYRIY